MRDKRASRSGQKSRHMTRKEQESAAAQRDAKQREEALLQKVDELGLGFTEASLPVDIGQEAPVKRSQFTALKAMVPYTSAWYEGNYSIIVD